MIIQKLFSIQKPLHNKPNPINKGSVCFPYLFYLTMSINKIFKSFNPFYFIKHLLFGSSLLFFSCTQPQSSNRPINHQTIQDTIYVDKTKRLIKLEVDFVRVDDYYKHLSGDKMVDGIPAFVKGEKTHSRWAIEGYPHYAVFYFDTLVSINKIRINLFNGEQGYTNHIKFYNFSDLLWVGDIGDSLWNNIHLNFYGTSIFLEISEPTSNSSNKINTWTDIGEVEFYGTK